MSAEIVSPARNLSAGFDPLAAWRLALPREHGSWSLALEPLVLGLLVAPSWAGAPLAVAATAGFFLRRPIKLLLQAKPDPRRPLAAFCAGTLTLIATAALWLAAQSGGWLHLWPLIPAAVAGLVFVWFDTRGENREETAELVGVTAFALLPAAFAALADWRMENCLALHACPLFGLGGSRSFVLARHAGAGALGGGGIFRRAGRSRLLARLEPGKGVFREATGLHRTFPGRGRRHRRGRGLADVVFFTRLWRCGGCRQ
jgi:hypothetical protein